MTPEAITIDGRSAVVLYLDEQWNPVSASDAVMARVLFEDGSSSFFTSRKARALGGPGSGNFGHKGRPGEVGGSSAWDGAGARSFPSGIRKVSVGLAAARSQTSKKLNLNFSVGEDFIQKHTPEKIHELLTNGEIGEQRAADFLLLRSVYDYKDGNHSRELNAALRAGKSLTEDQQRIVDTQQRMEVPLRGMTVYRGLKSELIDVKQFAVGKTVTMKGLVSTSADPEVALRFASKKDPILLEIKPKRGACFSCVANDGQNEREIVLAHKSSFKVVGLTRNKEGIRFIQLEQQ